MNSDKITEIDQQIAEIDAKLNDPKLAQGSASTMQRVSGLK
jgi:hypothetical protein